MTKADVRIETEDARRLADVGEDRGAVGDRLGFLPRVEGIAEGEHVRVGTHPGIAKEIPGAADGLARLEDGEGLAGALGLEPVASADARQSGADDEDVELVGGRVHLDTGTWRRARRSWAMATVAARQLSLTPTRLMKPCICPPKRRKVTVLPAADIFSA